MGPLDDSSHLAGLYPVEGAIGAEVDRPEAHDDADAPLHVYQEPMQSQLGIVGAPESPFQPESKLNPVDDVDLDRTPSSIKRICKKYALEHLTSSAELVRSMLTGLDPSWQWMLSSIASFDFLALAGAAGRCSWALPIEPLAWLSIVAVFALYRSMYRALLFFRY
ncbi:hypothetical protein Nepgr_022966 [Nepenthes gracilis]|uniref:Uncharacterized protein n=1 Tax=Nepenthes gracilis TaxID=150966 RepID=A0AAD3T1Y5_NEPGR|nr:hypothetical protein Nepgr_022966 [Nepenthes gracilis]